MSQQKQCKEIKEESSKKMLKNSHFVFIAVITYLRLEVAVLETLNTIGCNRNVSQSKLGLLA